MTNSLVQLFPWLNVDASSEFLSSFRVIVLLNSICSLLLKSYWVLFFGVVVLIASFQLFAIGEMNYSVSNFRMASLTI